jgi:hypothetical protein
MEKITTIETDYLFNSSKAEFWFENLIKSIEHDRTMLKTGLATKETEDFYSMLIEGNTTELIKKNREMFNQFLISKIIIDYVKLLAKEDVKPNKLAFDYSNSRVLVWAEVNDEKTEDDLILAQAEINAKYHEFGVNLSTSIVESEDKLIVPGHYRELTNQ